MITYYQDYVGGDDSNSGLTPAAAVKNLSAIYKKWQAAFGDRPQLPTSFVINMISPVPAGKFDDPVLQLNDVDYGPSVTTTVQPFSTTVKRSSTLSSVVNAFARTPTGRLTVNDTTVSSWTSDVDYLFVNTTQNGATWVIADSSGKGVLNPVRPVVDTTNIANILANGLGNLIVTGGSDQYEIITPLKVYLGTGSHSREFPTGDSNTISGLILERLWAVSSVASSDQEQAFVSTDAAFVEIGPPFTGSLVIMSECRLDVALVNNKGLVLLNCASTAAATGPAPSLQLGDGTVFASSTLCGYARGFCSLYGALADQDFTIYSDNDQSFVVGSQNTCFGSVARFGAAAPTGVFVALEGSFAFLNIGYPDTAVKMYGTGASGGFVLSVSPKGSVAAIGVFSSLFHFDGNAFRMGGQTRGYGFGSGAYVGPTNFDVTLVDVALGAGTGFGGMAIEPSSGARAGVDQS